MRSGGRDRYDDTPGAQTSSLRARLARLERMSPARSVREHEAHESLRNVNVSISAQAYEQIWILGISSRMVAETLNSPTRVLHLPLSNQRSYFCDFNGQTMRVMATLEDRVVTVSWTSNCPKT